METKGCPSVAKAWTLFLGLPEEVNRTGPVRVSAQQLAHGKVSAAMIIVAIINANP